jgi:thiamine biosynthesis lipoprotein
MQRRAFRSMGTDVEVLLDGVNEVDAPAAFSWAQGEFERLEALFSRFRDDSELSRLNADGEIDASPDMLAVVSAALRARERTGGRFDPTVHDALVAAGYDRTFELVARRTVRAGASPGPAGGAARIEDGRIELAPGVRLDLGGIVKGYAADCVAAELSTIAACLVNAGGDVAVRGVPSLGAWGVAVETPDGSMTLALVAGGLATSGADRRRWRTEAGERHHLIDPRTGRSADSDILRVTAAAGSAVEAEILAKALFLAGEHAGAAEADALGVPAVFVTRDLRVRMTGGLS